MDKFENACTSIADYLESKGWKMVDYFQWEDPITTATYPTCEAFIIQGYNDLKEQVGK